MPNTVDRRPRLPVTPLAAPALAAMAGIVADRYGDPWGTAAWATLGGAAAVAGLVLWRRAWAGAACLTLAFAAVAGGWHHYWWSDLGPVELDPAGWPSARPAWLRGIIWELPEFRPGDRRDDPGSTRIVLAVTGLCDGRRWHAATGRLLVSIRGDRSGLEPGMPVQAAGNLAAIAGPLNPGEADRRDGLRAHRLRLRLSVDAPGGVWPDPGGVPWRGRAWLGRLQRASRDRLAGGLDPRAVPLAAALLLGRREAVDPDVNDAFARTGTTHLLAISGLHLQVLSAALWWAFGWMGRKRALVGVALATVGYAVLVGLMPSVVRSAAMTVLACVAALCDRTTRPGNLLAAAALAVLAYNPAALFDAGCQLSFVAVAAVLWLVPATGRRLGLIRDNSRGHIYACAEPERTPDERLDELERRLRPWWQAVPAETGRRLALMGMGSLVVWLATLPLVWLRFHLVTPIGVLLNVPLIPMTSLALLLAGLSLMLGPVGGLPALGCEALLRWSEGIVRWGSDRRWGHAFAAGPAWPWVVAWYALLALAALATAARSRVRWPAWAALAAFSIALCSAALWPARPDALEAEVLAVGHGLAVVVRAPSGRAALYDCGQLGDPRIGRRVVAPALWARGVRRLDVVVLSHADADHYGGLPDLLDRVPIGELRVPPGFGDARNPGAARLLDLARARGVPVRPIVAGDRLDLGPGATLAALHPPAAWTAAEPDNARSVVLDLAAGGRRLLLTGDLDGVGLAEIAAHPPGRVDALLAPHHGGRTANPPWLYRQLDPALVLVSQRRPTPGTRDPLAAILPSSVRVLRTWQEGAIRLRWTDAGLVARGFLEGGEGR